MARAAVSQRGKRRRMKDFGLDLALIGNGRTAALVDPSARLVWWCFPRFDGDPIFSRLLSADQEKGFTERRSRRNGRIRLRLCSQHRGCCNRTDGRQGWSGQDHRFRAALSELRSDFPTRPIGPDHRAIGRHATNHHPVSTNSSIRNAACCRNRSAAIISRSEATTSWSG